jgi:hypothetical protein
LHAPPRRQLLLIRQTPPAAIASASHFLDCRAVKNSSAKCESHKLSSPGSG